VNEIDRIKELIELLNKASDIYYNSGSTIMSDNEFDTLMEELNSLESATGCIMANSPTQNVGAKVKSTLEKIQHTRPMLSLDKCHSVQELIDFAESDDCYLSVKCDGLTTRLIYENGELVSAETRGDGETGQQVLFHVEQYCNVPMHISATNRYVIDGESVIFYSDFESINSTLTEDEKFANPRNLASGTLSNLDSNITKQRNMRFIAWRVIEGDDTDDHFWRLKNAEKYGFTVSPMWTYANNSDDKNNLENMLHNLRKQANDIGLPMDGIVMAKNSHAKAESMGRTGKFFRHSIAYKFEDEVYETTLEYIDWTLGRTGILTPTAVFKPVEIDGAEVTRASMHNLSVMADLSNKNDYYKGMKLLVYKANQIIPQVKEAIGIFEDEIEGRILKTPTYCPVCGGLTEVKKDNNSEVLICTNPECAGKKLAKFTHFVSKKGMDIKNLSEATLETLISHGFIRKFNDIYYLSNHYGDLVRIDGFGKKSIDNLLKSIEDSRYVKLENFITALGIPNIGLTAAKTISKYFNGSYIEFARAHLNNFDWTSLNDFGQVMADNINNYLSNNFNEMDEIAFEMSFVLPKKTNIVENPFNGKTICVTGKLNHFTRDSINEKIVSLGAKAAESVSKNTDYLITNESSGSSKYKKATELNIPIITEEEFLKMLEE
jgi:DNA ligase (NAD+)